MRILIISYIRLVWRCIANCASHSILCRWRFLANHESHYQICCRGSPPKENQLASNIVQKSKGTRRKPHVGMVAMELINIVLNWIDWNVLQQLKEKFPVHSIIAIRKFFNPKKTFPWLSLFKTRIPTETPAVSLYSNLFPSSHSSQLNITQDHNVVRKLNFHHHCRVGVGYQSPNLLTDERKYLAVGKAEHRAR